MTLIELAQLRHELSKLLAEDAHYLAIEKACNRLPSDLISDSVKNELKSKLDTLSDAQNNIKEFIRKEIKKVDENIESILPKNYHTQDYQYNKDDPKSEFRCIHSSEHDKNYRRMDIEGELLETIRTIIGIYSDFKFPSLEIGCGQGDMTIHMKTADPLYVTDCHEENLTSTKNQFNEIYKKRIRCYWNRGDFTKFPFLPQSQFKFILAWNVFNYYPEFELTETLKSCWSLLRPGGNLMFSYNDCEFIESVRKFEQGTCTWMTGSRIHEILSDLGYEVTSIVHGDGEVHWVECQKPGELTTVKLHPSTGKINLLG